MGLGSRIKKIPPLYVSQRTANLLMNLRNYTRALHLPDVLSEIQIASTKPGGEPLMEAASLLSSGQGILVYQAIQKAKIELSKNSRSEIKYQLPGLAPISVPIDREALDGVVNSVLPLVEQAIEQSLLDSNWEYSEVDFVLMTGGSSQLQRFRERMNELFPNAKFVDSDPFLTVVRGLGLRARELWM
jgi:molecular chaperone DnaK (HSP70)